MSRDVTLSASRISTLKKCSWTYWCKYILKLPDTTNDGASRGWICHLIFEVLGNPRHKGTYNTLLLSDSIYDHKGIKKLVYHYASRLNVNDPENLQLISDMTLAGLHFDFFGDTRDMPDISISEKDFLLDIDEDAKRYRVIGFIDKLFLYKSAGTALIRDFKTSKQVFKGKDITDNLQDLIYCLAIKKLFPEYSKRVMEFLFVKFNLNSKGTVKMAPISDEELEGLEYELTGIQNYLENFTEKDAMSNFAGDKGYTNDGSFSGLIVCGKDGYKISRGQNVLDENGEPIVAYICPFRKPLTYYALLNKDGEVVKTKFEEEKHLLIADESKGEKIEEMRYSGCPRWI